MERKILIIMHTHWDREWYFTKDETRVLLVNHIQETMDFLEENEDIIYILDGQSIMIDDYLDLDPSGEDRLRKLIRKGQLRVGPWYTQTDLLLVHGESVHRNLYYGIKRAKEFGDPMLVGYAPDTFGHASQMPQIYSEFGIESTIFWRGFSELKASKSDFIWKGIDGSEVIGVNLATGYQGAKYLEEDLNSLKNRMKKIMYVLDSYSSGNYRLIMNGHDQMPIQKNIKEVIKNIKTIYPDDQIEIGNFEEYISALDQNILEKVEGELTDSKHARIHRTIGSTRMDIKLLNSEIENKLYNILEPLAIIGYQAGISYPDGVIESILKILFGTHAHDSIGGCNSDKVNQDIKQRLLCAKEMIDTQIELLLRLLTMGNKKGRQVIILLNLLPEIRKNEYVEYEMLTRTKLFKIFDSNGNEIDFDILSQIKEDAGLIDRQVAARLQDITVYRTKVIIPVSIIGGLSILYYRFEEIDDAIPKNKMIEMTNFIENKWGKLYIENNQFHFFDKVSNKVYQNIFSIENSGDAGDSYDYSPPVNDWIINSANIGEIEWTTHKSAFSEEINFNLVMKVPGDGEDREKKLTNSEISYKGNFRLYKNDPKVYGTLQCKNTVKDSRHRLVLKTDIYTDKVFVDGYLSEQEKSVYLEKELSIWESENWVEKPISVETAQSYISLKGNDQEWTIYTKGLKEYEILNDEIHVTLLRSFSHLGKRELINRPGRPSGIEIPTPDNQLIGKEFTFEFAFGCTRKEENRAREAKKYLSPLIGYQRKEFNRFNLNENENIRRVSSSLDLDLNETIVSAIKLTEKKELFIRVFNPTPKTITIQLPKNSFYSDGLENKKERISELVMYPQQIGNIIIER